MAGFCGVYGGYWYRLVVNTTMGSWFTNGAASDEATATTVRPVGWPDDGSRIAVLMTICGVLGRQDKMTVGVLRSAHMAISACNCRS
jgi:hypothetical protein